MNNSNSELETIVSARETRGTMTDSEYTRHLISHVIAFLNPGFSRTSGQTDRFWMLVRPELSNLASREIERLRKECEDTYNAVDTLIARSEECFLYFLDGTLSLHVTHL